jgi:hypothetical protein
MQLYMHKSERLKERIYAVCLSGLICDCCVGLSVVCGTPRSTFAQVEEVLLRVEGEIARPLTLSPVAFAQLPRTVVQVRDREGTVSTYALGSPVGVANANTVSRAIDALRRTGTRHH